MKLGTESMEKLDNKHTFGGTSTFMLKQTCAISLDIIPDLEAYHQTTKWETMLKIAKQKLTFGLIPSRLCFAQEEVLATN